MSVLRWIGQALGIRGDLQVNGSIATRTTPTGGGDVKARTFEAGPVGAHTIIDTTGAVIAGFAASGLSPSDPIVIFTGTHATGTDPVQIAKDGSNVHLPASTSTTQSQGDNSTKLATTAYADKKPFKIPLFSGSASTLYGSSSKRVLGSFYFDPTNPVYGLTGSSTATLCMLLESTSGSVAAAGELFQKSGTGAPQVIAATSTTTSTTAVLVTANVSAAFHNTSPAGIFCARLWIATPNGLNEATCTGAWIEVIP